MLKDTPPKHNQVYYIDVRQDLDIFGTQARN